LNRWKKFRRWFDPTARCKEPLRIDPTPAMSSTEQIRSIRRRAAGAPSHSPPDSRLRMEHVARLRTAIANGSYHVSAEDLAQKMIDTLLKRKPSKS
jgi:anti-sigma28 factor (negative regulator of flagellin synthesis)